MLPDQSPRARHYPRSGNTCDSLGEAFALKGDKHQAMAGYSKALAMVKDPAIKLPLPP